MTRVRTQRAIRPAFTLVELMVAMALSIGIMWILAESFKMGIDFTRYARSTGQMMTQLNGVGAVMSRDLQAQHFLRDDTNTFNSNGGMMLSDQRVDLANSGWTPPKNGFFRIISPTSAIVAQDQNFFNIDTATNHALHFTAILSPSDQNLFSVNSGGNTYSSRSAEVAYFLVDSGLRTSPGPTGQTLYNLIRRQRLVATTSDDVSSLKGAAADTDVIASNGTTPFTLADLTNPNNRLPILLNAVPGAQTSPLTFQLATNPSRYGEDLLLSNVLSFEVLVDWNPSGVAGSNNAVPTFNAGNTEFPFGNLSTNPGQNFTPQGGQGVFDTWNGPPTNTTWFSGPANKIPLAVRVKQIQVTIRMFDPKTKQSRQNTWKFGP